MKRRQVAIHAVLLAFLLAITLFSNLAVAQGGTWTTKADMPVPTFNMGVDTINRTLYSVGGEVVNNCYFVNTVFAYDPIADAWTSKASMPTRRSAPEAGVVDGKLYAVGGAVGCGAYTGVNEEYDPGNNSWSTRAPMPTPRVGFAIGVVDGVLFAIGGNTNSPTWLDVTEAYDPGTNTWTSRAPMPAPRTTIEAAVANGVIYVMGGLEQSGATSDRVDAYDPKTDTWTTKSPMPRARYKFTAAEIKGKIYLVGGSNPAGYIAVTDVYDPTNDSWSTAPPSPTLRRDASAGVVDDTIYVLGGYAVPVTGQLVATNQAFTPTTPNQPPTAIAGGNQTLEATGPGGIGVTLDGSASSDPDNDPLTYEWRDSNNNLVGNTALITLTVPLGVHTFTLTVNDGKGATDSTSVVIDVRDTTPPVLTLPPLDSVTHKLVADATNPAGAVVNFTATATDIVDPHPAVSCQSPSGSSFVIGTTTVTCTATDNYGNMASGSFSVLVKAAAEQVADLIVLVDSFNLKQGIENSLDKKLANAMVALNEANAGNRVSVCNMLGAFINETQAQSGKALTHEQAAELIDNAYRIRTVVGCQ